MSVERDVATTTKDNSPPKSEGIRVQCLPSSHQASQYDRRPFPVSDASLSKQESFPVLMTVGYADTLEVPRGRRGDSINLNRYGKFWSVASVCLNIFSLDAMRHAMIWEGSWGLWVFIFHFGILSAASRFTSESEVSCVHFG